MKTKNLCYFILPFLLTNKQQSIIFISQKILCWGWEKRQMHLAVQEMFTACIHAFSETMNVEHQHSSCHQAVVPKGNSRTRQTKSEAAKWAARLRLNPSVCHLLSCTVLHAMHRTRRMICRNAPARARSRGKKVIPSCALSLCFLYLMVIYF